MCGIFAMVGGVPSIARKLIQLNTTHGRDGFGIWHDGFHYKTPGECARPDDGNNPLNLLNFESLGIVLANCRAEPTTELVYNPTSHDQQPYIVGDWVIVHNGTIANDKQLIEDYDLKPPTRIDSWVIAGLLDALHVAAPSRDALTIFRQAMNLLEGSFAVCAYHHSRPGVFYATNYRPLYYSDNAYPAYRALSSVPMNGDATLVPPYTVGYMDEGTNYVWEAFRRPVPAFPRTLVILSGGLDSTVVATHLIREGHHVECLHFTYGCRAEGQERTAVELICHKLNVPLRVISMREIFTQIGHSRLLDGSKIENGEAGAEMAIEWVPARNTIMASVAMGIAEAEKFDHIALGINLEESGGGYTDNVLDLYDGLNSLMQWIIGVNKRLSFISPVGHLMKHEIVAMGLQDDAPLDLTWSCYNHGDVHCGNCGPCTMRRRAFEVNGRRDPVFECRGAA